ncbi:hypothetical protein [Actinomadura sp. NTSP31]|uniref:hypothetical protein n=1 Tax=Actinomadura sp. NTSP31 TaxID=1735447 RepID=UPI0035C23CBD
MGWTLIASTQGSLMRLVCDYFRAPDRTTALFLHFTEYWIDTPLPDAEAVRLKSIDPYVMLGTLIRLLLSRATFEDVLYSGIPELEIPDPELLTPEDDDPIIVELDVLVRDTLAQATQAEMDAAAPLWAQTEEFVSREYIGFPEAQRAIADLAGLAGRAKAAGQMMYCLICPFPRIVEWLPPQAE